MADSADLADLFATLTAGSETFNVFTKQAEKVTQALDDQQKKINVLNEAVKSGAYAKFVKGRDQLDAAERVAKHAARVEELRARYGAFGATAIGAGMKVQAAVNGMTAGMQTFAGVAQRSFAGAALSIYGLARSGFAGTAEIARLGVQFQFLTQAIAAIFIPVVNSVTEKIAQLTQWLSGLDEEQQDNILSWVQGAVVGLAVAAMLPKVFMGISALVGGFNLLTAAITGTLSSTGLGALLPILGFAVAGIAALVAGTAAGRSAFGDLWKTLEPIGAVIQKVFSSMYEIVGPIIQRITDLWSQGMAVVMPLVTELGELFGELARNVMLQVGVAFNVLAAIVQSVVIPALKFIVPVIKEVISWIKEMVQSINWGMEKLGMIGKESKSIANMTDKEFKALREGVIEAGKTYNLDVSGNLKRMDAEFAAAKQDREKDKKPGRKVTPAQIITEQTKDTFMRLQKAALNVGTIDYAAQTAEHTKQIAANTGGTKRAVQGLRPAVVDSDSTGSGGSYG